MSGSKLRITPHRAAGTGVPAVARSMAARQEQRVVRAAWLRSRGTPFLFLLPALVWYVVFLGFPMASSFATSLTDWDGFSHDRSFVGLSNYQTSSLRIASPVRRSSTMSSGPASAWWYRPPSDSSWRWP